LVEASIKNAHGVGRGDTLTYDVIFITGLGLEYVSGFCYTCGITKGKTMGNLIELFCQPCRGENNTSTIIRNLCTEHYFEWAEEKMYMELESSTEGLYL
jgi:hypothetical protein